MPSVEAVIVAIWLFALACIVIGAAGVVREWARVNQPPRERHRATHRAVEPSLWARLAEAYLAGAKEMAAASALLKGEVPLW